MEFSNGSATISCSFPGLQGKPTGDIVDLVNNTNAPSFLKGIRDIFKQLLEKVQMLTSHTPVQDIEKVFKFYTVKFQLKTFQSISFALACRSNYESG